VNLKDESAALNKAVAAMRHATSLFIAKVTGNLPDAIVKRDLAQAVNLFETKTNGEPDASLVFGVMINSDFNVGAFLSEQPESFSSRIILKDITVENIKVSPGEIGALVDVSEVDGAGTSTKNPYQSSTNVHDAVGAIFDVDFAVDDEGKYKANPLADLQLAFADYANKCVKLEDKCATSASPAMLNLLTRQSLGPAVVSWALRGSPATLGELLKDHQYAVTGNTDVMFHAIKGLVGIKLDGVADVTATNVVVTTCKNEATEERRSKMVLAADPASVYEGFNTRGLSIASSINVDVSAFKVQDLVSTSTDVMCDEIMFDFKNVLVQSTCDLNRGHEPVETEVAAAHRHLRA
jgi:hypothetical protein